MKKKLIILFITLLIFLTSCEGDNELVASEKALSYGKQAIEIGTQYLEGKISNSDAYDKLNEIYNSMEYVDINKEEDIPDLHIQSDILYLKSSILNDSIKSDSDSYQKVKKNVESLEKRIKD